MTFIYIGRGKEKNKKKCILIYIYVCVCGYIYIYIYIYIKSSTDRSVLFYQNSSEWLDILASRCWDQNTVDLNANPSLYPSAMRKQ